MTTDQLLPAPEETVSAEHTAELADRLLARIGHAASVNSVFGPPVAAGGRTVIPVARTWFAFGGLGGQAGGKATIREPGLRTALGGGGGIGAGLTFASGYIEVSSDGTRYVAVSNNRDRAIGALAGLVLAVVLILARSIRA